MAYIVVCPLARIESVIGSHAPRQVVSLLTADHAVPRLPSAIDAHLHLALSDIAEPMAGHRLASTADMARLLDFFDAWDRADPLLVHCYAGVSRSTAAAFAALCLLDPGRTEMDHAIRLRRASPTATPNPRLVTLADAALGRAGRMVAAVTAIGRGADCYEGNVFSLEVPARTGCEAGRDAVRLGAKG